MTHLRVHSSDDERVAVYRDLPSGHLTRESGLFIAEGHLLVQRLLTSSFRPHSILLDERRLSQLPECPASVPIYMASAELLKEILGFPFHRGVLAAGYRREPQPFDSWAGQLGTTALAVSCVGISDPTNLGGILRNCAAFSADAVITTRRGADPFARRAVRVSMGAALEVPIVETDDISQSLSELRDRFGFELIAAVSVGGEPLDSVRKADRTVLLIGNEAHGLPGDVVQLADRRVTIPMPSRTDSLNAAVASGVFLYHFSQLAAGRVSESHSHGLRRGLDRTKEG